MKEMELNPLYIYKNINLLIIILVIDYIKYSFVKNEFEDFLFL